MSSFTKLEPYIYKIVEKPKDSGSGYDLAVVGETYSIKKKLYGIVNKLIPRITKLIQLKKFEFISIIATGGKGLGKTTSMNKICKSILEAGIPVIEVKYIKVTLELIDFISDFRNVCIYIDEFGKNFTKEEQDKMLTLLNRKDGYYNIFILGENERNLISQYILDRMERARYNIHLSRIANEDLKQYAVDNNLSADVTNNLLALNKTSSKISYDTLDAISEESRIFPECSFDELVEVMNVKGILGIPVVVVLELVLLENEDYYVSGFDYGYGAGDKLRYSKFMEEGYTLYLNCKLKKIKKEGDNKEEKDTPPPTMGPPYWGANSNDIISVSINATSSDVTSIDDLEGLVHLECKTNGYRFKLVLTTKIISID